MNYILDPVSAIASSDGARPFAVLPDRVLRYNEIDRRIAFACDQLRRNGLGPGDVIALYNPGAAPDPDSMLRRVVLILAALRLGIIVAPLGRHLPPNSVLALLDQLGGAALVGADGLDLLELTHGEQEPGTLYSWKTDRPATIVFTSGSTGAPKAAVHSFGNHYWSAKGWAEHFPVSPTDRWLLNLPLNHVGGLAMLFRAVFAGGSIAIPDSGKPFVETLQLTGSTIVSAVPTQMLRALGESKNEPPRTLRMMLLGGSSSSMELLRNTREHGWPVSLSYGMTEMSSTIAATSVEMSAEHESAGVVLPYRDVRLNTEGEIMLRGETRFMGYRSGNTMEQPFDEDGWFASGDLGERVEMGGERRLRVVGRKDNRFISGGENIQPESIERVLLTQDGIRRVLVVPISHEEFGERPVAFVDAENWKPDAWIRAIRSALPSFFVPDKFISWPSSMADIEKPSRIRFAELARESV